MFSAHIGIAGLLAFHHGALQLADQLHVTERVGVIAVRHANRSR